MEMFKYNSLEVANRFNKKHMHIMRDIDVLIDRDPYMREQFVLNDYTNSRGRKYRCYEMTQLGYSFFTSKWNMLSKYTELESGFGKWLDKLFPNEKITKQYRVLKYNIDFYMDDLNICIEYDEAEHKNRKEQDVKRQSEIQEELKRLYLLEDNDPVVRKKPACESFPFVRVQEGKEIEGVRELLLTIEDRMWNSPTNYMR
jgi:Phage regulatory protein Rha (Phage_pRha)/Protein of unknown function (DUF559)